MAGNIDIVRAAIEAFDRRDPAAFGVYLDPDVIIVPVRAAVEGTLFRGPNAAAEYCAAVDESWESLHWDIEEMCEGPDWVLALGRIRGSGRGSGAALDLKAGWVARLRDGLITRFETHADRTAAFDAVGLTD